MVQHVMKSTSASDICQSPQDRAKKIREYYPNYTFYLEDCVSYDTIYNIFSNYHFDTIFYLSHQPSAPFSHINYSHSYNTILNNVMSTINLIWLIREFNPKCHLITIGSMGEYDPAVNVDIPEGLFSFEYNGRQSKESIFPRRPGSYYHASKVASTYLIDCMCRFSKTVRATDIMQGVVYGLWTSECEKTGLNTRMDFDECFGTVVHRFIIQSLLNKPLTIFGEGLHSRGFLALNDSIQCLELAMNNLPEEGEYRSWNQLDQVFTMEEIANQVVDTIGGKKSYVKSPRAESVNDHYYDPCVDKLKNLGFHPTREIQEEIKYVCDNVDKQRFKNLNFDETPMIKWW